jgi:hypothetical protein
MNLEQAEKAYKQAQKDLFILYGMPMRSKVKKARLIELHKGEMAQLENLIRNLTN